MGYTHYWNFKKGTDFESAEHKAKFALASKLSETVINKIPKEIEIEQWDGSVEKVKFKICGGDGTGKPVFSDDCVNFNGCREDGDDYESMYIPCKDEDNFNFCKTARHNYDVAVCITLICFKKIFGEGFEYRSDGNINKGEEGWKLANQMCSNVFRTMRFKTKFK